ncbi:unnamed protein product [Moneuplotes crassus]|uniref:Uncharacterized protein n=1 Tax=Euplotes crassus TaxID=5936 RepID=A0AAD2D1J6_EUPCR|nr:unnamed protein product [Moneuplotes crassus]
MKSIPKTIEEENTDIVSLEKSVLAKTKKLDISRCQSILYKIYPYREEIEPLGSDSEEVPENSQLMIYFSELEDMKFAQSFKKLKFFDINWVNLSFDGSKNKHLVDFLASSFLNKTNCFDFRSMKEMDLNKSNYLKPLLNLSSKVVQQVTFYNFFIGFSQLKILVAAYKHVREFTLWHCKLSIPRVPNFSKALTNCQIQELNLNESKGSYKNSWENNFDEFKNLIQGLASSPDLRSSLKKVEIYEYGVKKYEAEQIFEENQLGGVEVFGDN